MKREMPVRTLRERQVYKRKPRPFINAFVGSSTPAVIAEIKFASPSEGFLREDRKPSAQAAVEIASSYLGAGAAAISVLTERNFFAGDPEFLSAVRAAHPEAPLLMKDFFIDPYQFELARACGADCVLLIVALAGTELKAKLDEATALGLSVLVEAHDERELGVALSAGAELIGVNSRDLRTLKTDLEVARRLAPLAKGKALIAESGIRGSKDIADLRRCGYRGFLIGTSLMKAPDPGAALNELLA